MHYKYKYEFSDFSRPHLYKYNLKFYIRVKRPTLTENIKNEGDFGEPGWHVNIDTQEEIEAK